MTDAHIQRLIVKLYVVQIDLGYFWLAIGLLLTGHLANFVLFLIGHWASLLWKPGNPGPDRLWVAKTPADHSDSGRPCGSLGHVWVSKHPLEKLTCAICFTPSREGLDEQGLVERQDLRFYKNPPSICSNSTPVSCILHHQGLSSVQ